LFFKNEANAIAAQKKLESGVDFGTLAEEQDATLGGDLGWFPRGMLTQPEVEAAVFAMQPGETSGIIASSLGYHIVNVLERENDHPLSTEARLMLQEKALQDWLTAEREKSTIEILVP
jgi:peptidyl-prolyl cis-trans isomerase C